MKKFRNKMSEHLIPPNPWLGFMKVGRINTRLFLTKTVFSLRNFEIRMRTSLQKNFDTHLKYYLYCTYPYYLFHYSMNRQVNLLNRTRSGQGKQRFFGQFYDPRNEKSRDINAQLIILKPGEYSSFVGNVGRVHIRRAGTGKRSRIERFSIQHPNYWAVQAG